MKMPIPDTEIISRRSKIIAALSNIISSENVIFEDDALRVYECDGLSAYRQLPMAVVLPETTAQVSAILKYCYNEGIKVVPRGAGTSLSGGALSESLHEQLEAREIDPYEAVEQLMNSLQESKIS